MAQLPFWSPLIPPMGISCLKGFLQARGWPVKTLDANIEEQFKEIYDGYFRVLREIVPLEKQGNFYSIGQDVLHNHMMAFINYNNPATGPGGKDEQNRRDMYDELVKTLIAKTFYCLAPGPCIHQLHAILEAFYTTLESYILQWLEKEKPGVLGLSVCSGTLPASLFAFQLTKEKCPWIQTVIGGGIFCDQFAIGTADFEIFLEETAPYIDKIIIGEGELLFLKYLQGELPPEQRVYTPGDIGEETLDLSTAGIPDCHDFQLQHYPYLSMYSSRSCPHRCHFCSDTVMWGKYRKKPTAQVVEEMKQLYREFGNQLFMMSDLLLNPVVTGLAEAFTRSDTTLYWDGCLRAEPPVCKQENTMLWRRGGFYRARIGCESGSAKILKLMGKGITIEQIKQSIAALALAGIQTTTYWVLGYPGESEDDFQNTLDLIEELREDIYEAECRPFYYYLQGQVNSREWAKQAGHLPLYPGKFKPLLLFQTWGLEGLPGREETYRRINRFVRHCRELGIPNPYTMKDIDEADRRWKKLHTNAVPSLLELKNKDVYIDECKHVQNISLVDNTLSDEGNFDF